MNDFFYDMGLAVLFKVLKDAVKDAKKKASIKKAMLKLRNAINSAYADDQDFVTTE